jgi:hypothetical protein
MVFKWETKREISSAGSEHLVYTEGVGGSNPSFPTKALERSRAFFVYVFISGSFRISLNRMLLVYSPNQYFISILQSLSNVVPAVSINSRPERERKLNGLFKLSLFFICLSTVTISSGTSGKRS